MKVLQPAATRLAAVAMIAGIPSIASSALPAHAQVVPSTAVTACGTQITSPGAYSLTGNVGPCPSFGIGIFSSGVTLDLAGFTLSGSGTNDGVFVDPGALLDEVTSSAAGGTITGFTNGVNANGQAVILNQISSSGNSVGVAAGTAVVCNACTADNDHVGFAAGQGFVCLSCFADHDTTGYLVANIGDGAAALLLGSHGRSDTTGVDITSSSGARVINSVFYNDGTGILVDSGSLGTLLYANHSTFNQYGIFVNAHLTNRSLGALTVSIGNTAVNNSLSDIFESNVSCLGDVWLADTFKTANQPCVR